MLKYLALLLFAASAVAQPFPARPGPVIISQPSAGGSSSGGVDTNAVIALIEQYGGGGGGVVSNAILSTMDLSTQKTNGNDYLYITMPLKISVPNGTSAATASGAYLYTKVQGAGASTNISAAFVFGSPAGETNTMSVSGMIPPGYVWGITTGVGAGGSVVIDPLATSGNSSGIQLMYLSTNGGSSGSGISSATATNIAAYQAYLATNGFTGGVSAAQVAAIMATNQAAWQSRVFMPWTENAMRESQPISIGFLGDSIMATFGPLTSDSDVVQMLQRRYGTNGGFSMFASDGSLYGTWGSGGSYRTNTAGTHTGESLPWVYGVLPAGGIAYFQESSTDGFVYANRAHVSWRVKSGGGNLLVKTRAGPSFSPTTTHLTINTGAGGVVGTSAFTNVAIASGDYQLMLEASGGTVELLQVAFYNTNSTGVLIGQLAQAGKTDWSTAPFTNWAAGVNGFQPTTLIISEKNNTTYFPTFLAMLTQLKTVWTNTDFICLGSQPDTLDGIQDRVTLNNNLRRWASTNNATYYEIITGDTNAQFQIGFQTPTDTPHNTTAGNKYIYSQLFKDLGLIRGVDDWNTNATDYVVGNRVTGRTNIAPVHVGAFLGNGIGLTNLANVRCWATNTQISYTGTTTETNLWSFDIPAGSLGNNGWVEIVYAATSNDTTAKTLHFRLGGVDCTPVASVATLTHIGQRRFNCRNSAYAKMSSPATFSATSPDGTSSGAIYTYNVGTDTNVTFTITGTLTESADTISLEAAQVKVFYVP